MAHPTAPAPRVPFVSVRDQLAGQQGLPFLAILSRPMFEAACRALGHQWRERVYLPWITLSLFLSQVLSDGHSCDEAGDRFQVSRHNRGLPPVSAETTNYREARARLPEALFWELVRRTGRATQERTDPSWLFHGRPVKILEGSTVTMPDTEPNQRVYPQLSGQAPGLGFPIARILVVFSLAVGTVLEAAIGPYQGKQTSELALLRTILDKFRPGDIALADRFFGSYWVIATLRARGVDCGGAAAPAPSGRLPLRRSAGPRRPRRNLEEARAGPRLDESGGLRGDAGAAGSPRIPGADPGQVQACAAVSDRHDADGCAGLPGQGPGGPVPAAVARGSLPGRRHPKMRLVSARPMGP